MPAADGLEPDVALGSVGDGLAPELASDGGGDESGDCRSRLLSCLVIGVVLLVVDRASLKEPVIGSCDAWLYKIWCGHCACCIHTLLLPDKCGFVKLTGTKLRGHIDFAV